MTDTVIGAQSDDPGASDMVPDPLAGSPWAAPQDPNASPEESVRWLLAGLRDHLGMEVAFVGEFDQGHRVIRYVSADGDCPLIVGTADPLDDTLCRRIVDGQLPGVMPDTAEVPEVMELPFVRDLGIRSYVGAPLIVDGRLYGTVGAFSTSPDHSLRERDGRTATVLAFFIAGVLQRFLVGARTDHERVERIERVLAGQGLSIVFQPIVDLLSGSVVGAEALSRFQSDPYRPPNEWFADAAAVGLGVALELFAARLAIAHLDDLPAKTYLSVNLSPAAVKAAVAVGLVDGINGGRVVIELTEHEAIEDYENVVRALASLHARGCRIAVDDAGSGFASLRHILRLSPDIIKLDISLTRDIDADPARRALASALTVFARATGARIVAEGIETANEMSALTALGIRYGQGYYLGKPGALPIPLVVANVDVDMPELPRDEERTRRQRLHDRLEAVFAEGDTGMAMLATDGTFLHVNPALCKMSARTADDLMGGAWRGVIDPEHLGGGVELLEAMLTGATNTFSAETRVIRLAQAPLPVRVDVTAIRDALGRLSFFFAEVHPIPG